MAQTLTGTINSNTSFLNQNALPLSVTYTGTPGKQYSKTFASSDITKVFFASYTVTTSSTTIDLTSLTDAYGAAISFTTVKHLQILNNDATNSLLVGGGTNAVFSSLPSLVAGGCYNLTTNLAVSGSTKNLALTAGALSIGVDVLMVGI